MAVKTVDFRSQAKQPAVPAPGKNLTDQTVYFRITTNTPVHIGCDEVYEPTSFVIDTRSRELISFETASFLEQLDSEALGKFSAICKKGTIVSLLELMKFMRSQAEHADGQRVSLPPAFLEHYESTLALPLNENRVKQELNNFQIKRTAFDPLSASAYIPGSAIKGSIRTAILNLRNQGKHTPSFRGKHAGRELQEHLFDFDFHHLESDPFRLLKVSDFFPVDKAKQAIVYAVDQKKKISDKDAQAPYQILETVVAGTEFVGSLTLLAPPRGCDIKQPLTMEEVTTSLRSFYGDEKKREDRELVTIGCNPVQLSVETKTHPMRLGRHSGAECVTVNGHRNIKIKQGGGRPPKDLPKATTIWLAAGVKKPTIKQNLQPFGWVQLEPLSPDHGRQELQKAATHKARSLDQMGEKIAARKKREEERIAQKEAEERAAAEKAARLAAEAAEREAAAKRERQALAAMSETERLLYFIQQPNISEEVLDHLISQLDGLPADDQQQVAATIRDRWESENKWIKKQCSDAQWKRVQQVRAFLESVQESPTFSPEEQAAIEQVKAINGWRKEVVNLIATLPLAALNELRKKMKDEWGCAEKRAKNDKQQAWKSLERRIRELKNA